MPMPLSRMNSNPTAVDRLPSAQPVTPTTTIAKACGRLRATGEAVRVDPQGDTYETVRAPRRTAWDWLEHRRA